MSWHIPVWLWLIHTALGGSLVLLLGCLAIRFCKQPVLRLRIAELTLLGCLLLPWASFLPFLPRFSLPLLGSEAPPPVAAPDPELGSASVYSEPRPSAPDSPPRPESPGTAGDSTPAPSRAVAAPIDPPRMDWRLPPLSLVVVGGYAAGVVLFAGRWLLALILLARLRRSARPVPPRVEALFENLAGPPGRRVRLRMSDRVCLPLTFNWRRPIILLPAGHCVAGEEEGLLYGLAHEWSHAQRGDVGRWHLSTLAGLLFYWQPLFWWLRRQLRLDQDFLADALAANQAEEREDYAAYLVRVARFSLDRPLVGSLGIANRSSNLSRRVHMLLNNKKPLRRHCPGPWNTALAVAAITIVGLVSAVRLDAGDDPKAKPDTKLASRKAPEVKGSEKGETLNYSGVVTDQDTGKPIEGATVTVRRSVYGDPEVKVSDQLLQETKHKTDRQGKYHFTIPPEQSSKGYLYLDLDAEGPGYAPRKGFGYALSMIRKNEKMGARPFFEAITLRPGKEVRGVVETPEGKPAAGVKVRSYSVTTKKSKERFEFGSFSDTKTDINGHFSLTVVTPGNALFWVLPAKYAPSTHLLKENRRGDQGKIVLEKGAVMRGKVLDAKGKPVAGVFVHAGRDSQDEALNMLGVSEQVGRTGETNAKGEFTLAPLPAGTYTVQPQESGDDPSGATNRRKERELPGVFMPQKVVLKEGAKGEPVELQAVPHVIVEGQYFDSKGKKTRGHAPFLFGMLDGQRWISQMKTDANGKVRARVPHGLTEVQVQMMSNEHGAIRHRKSKDDKFSRGRYLFLDLVEGDVTGIEIVTYKAPILLVKVTTKGKAKLKGLGVTLIYPEKEARGIQLIVAGRGTDVTFKQQKDGRFRSTQLLPDEEVTVTAYADGHAERSMKLKLTEGATKEIEIVLEPK